MYETMTLDETFKSAIAKGMVVKIPSDHELFLDIDSKEDFTHFQKIIGYLPDVKGWIRSESKSGYPKCHVTVTMNRVVTNGERILLQAVLGSDRLHELLSYLASRQGHTHPTVFFERR